MRRQERVEVLHRRQRLPQFLVGHVDSRRRRVDERDFRIGRVDLVERPQAEVR